MDISSTYKQANPIAYQVNVQTPTAVLVGGPTVAVGVGQALSATLRLSNPAGTAREFLIGWYLNGTTGTRILEKRIATFPAESVVLDGGETRDIQLTIPWVTIEPWARPLVSFELTASVSCDAISFAQIAQRSVVVSAVPVNLIAAPAGTVRFNDVVYLDLSLHNSTAQAIEGITARLVSGGSLLFANNSFRIEASMGSVPVGGELHYVRVARAIRKGSDKIAGTVSSVTSSGSSAMVSVNIVGCLGDLDGGDSVDDADFSLFVQACDACLVPPADPAADLNRDGVVEDSDLALFTQAYDRGSCEGIGLSKNRGSADRELENPPK